MTTYGLLIFDGVEELDFQGPHSVLSISARMRDNADTVLLLAEHPGPITGDRGMRVLPDHTLDDHPALDVLLVPGGDAKTEGVQPRSGRLGQTHCWGRRLGDQCVRRSLPAA